MNRSSQVSSDEYEKACFECYVKRSYNQADSFFLIKNFYFIFIHESNFLSVFSY